MGLPRHGDERRAADRQGDTAPVQDLDAIRDEVAHWFTLPELVRLQGERSDPAGRHGQAWLAQAGKRWRPFLVVCAARALSRDHDATEGLDMRRVAVAVECFHKASLIHDDIEDEDGERYGCATMHRRIGVPAAINVGDYLVGEGYRLLSELTIPAERARRILQVAATGHQQLSVGQGRELEWRRAPGPVSELEVLKLFRDKTAPAFSKALVGGALFGGGDERLLDVLAIYSERLGIAYQIRDDLEDFHADGEGADLHPSRVSLVLSLAWQRADAADRALLEAWWQGRAGVSAVYELVQRTDSLPRMQGLLEDTLAQAEAALLDIDNPTLQALLRGVIRKIFN